MLTDNRDSKEVSPVTRGICLMVGMRGLRCQPVGLTVLLRKREAGGCLRLSRASFFERIARNGTLEGHWVKKKSDPYILARLRGTLNLKTFMQDILVARLLSHLSEHSG